MIAETHNSFRDPRRIECTRVVVRDNFGNPLAIVVEVDSRTFEVYKYTEPEFNRVLRNLGIEGVVVVDQIDPTGLEQPPGELWVP